MEFKLKELDSCKRELEGKADYQELQPHFEKALVAYRKKVQIPGFRKGKAPLSLVKKMYGQEIEYTALDDIANDLFRNYIKENKVEIVGQAKLMDMDYKPNEEFTFKVEFEIIPQFEVTNIDNLEVTKTNYVIDESLVEQELKYLLLQHSSYELDGKALDDNYMVTIDLQELDSSGLPVVGAVQKDIRVYLASESLEREFKEKLRDISENEERIVEIESDNRNKKYLIKCTKVEKVVFPELTEETLEKMTGRKGLKTDEDLKQYIRENMNNFYRKLSENNLKDEIQREVVKLNDIPVPESLVNVFLEEYVKEYKKAHHGHNHKIDEDEIRKEYRSRAIFDTKWYLLSGKLIELFGLKVDEEDVKKIAEETSKSTNIPVDKLIPYFSKNEEVREKILKDKLIDELIKKSKIKEVEEIKSVTSEK
ncbi:MAG: trigger factor [Ignavibacteria bacterium]